MRKKVLLFLSALFFLWGNTAFSQSTETVFNGTVRSFTINGNINWQYNWTLENPQGTQITLTSTSIQTEDITFDQLGTYILRVQATNQFGCLSEWVSKMINVIENPEPLEAVDDDYTTLRNEPVSFSPFANDHGVTSQTTKDVPVQTVQGGTLQTTSGNTYLYTPPAGFVGADSFTYRLCTDNTKNDCSEATVTFTVVLPGTESENPVAVNDINLGWSGKMVSGNVLVNDLFYDSGEFELKVLNIPLESTGKLASFNKKTGAYTFTPAAGYSGEAVFEYLLCKTLPNGQTACDTALVSIRILDPTVADHAPVANSDAFVTYTNQPVDANFLMNDFDVESDELTIRKVDSSSLLGNLTWNDDGSFSYKPATGFVGTEHFNYQLCDDQGNCSWSTVTIDVLNDYLSRGGAFAPDHAYYTTGILTGQLSAISGQPGNQTLVFQASSALLPEKGTVSIQTDGTFVYSPNQGVKGTFADRFSYQVCSSGEGAECSVATVYLVGNVYDIEIYAETVVKTGSCVPVELSAVVSGGSGKLSYLWSPETFLSDATVLNPVFTPGESTDYELTVTDGLGKTASKTIRVEVAAKPQVVVDHQLFVSGSSEMVILDALESIGEDLSFNWWSDQSGIIVSGGSTATPQVRGIGKYYVQITDLYGCSAIDSVSIGLYIQVQAVNDTTSTLVNTSVDINVLRNDIPQGDLNPKTITIVTPPGNGVATITTDSVITYMPNQYYVGQDNFVYAVCNYFNECDEAVVLVMIRDESLVVPNAFSPNGDGYNDYFVIKGLGGYERVSFKVFNRWGGLVYESSNYGIGDGKDGFWDGKVNRGIRVGNGDVPPGTYYYILDLGGVNEKLSGFIYLDR